MLVLDNGQVKHGNYGRKAVGKCLLRELILLSICLIHLCQSSEVSSGRVVIQSFLMKHKMIMMNFTLRTAVTALMISKDLTYKVFYLFLSASNFFKTLGSTL